MRIIIVCCLFFLACNSDSKGPATEKDTSNASRESSLKNDDQQKAEAVVKEYAINHSKGKPDTFVFGKLEKSNGEYADEAYLIKCAFRETYDDGGNPMNMDHTYFLDKDFKVVRVEY